MTGGHLTAVLPVIGVHSLYKDTCMFFYQKKMPDYTQAKIYKVSSPNHSLCYYGSTVKTLAVRMSEHKTPHNGCTSKQIIDAGDADIQLIEEYPCINKHELEDREAEVMQANWDGCVNEMVPGAKRRAGGEKAYSKKYYEKNAVRIRAQIKEYHKKNADSIRARKNEKCLCECGGKYTHSHKQRHFKSKMHQDHTAAQSPV